jgi:protein O-mannosyl-transferase
LHRPVRDTLIGLLPWFCIAIAIAIIARVAQPSPNPSPLWARPLIAGDSLAFYLSKLFLPVHLVMDYARTPQSVLNESPRAAFWTWIFPAALLVILILNRRRWPMLLAGAVIFFVALLPNLGFAPFSFQLYSTVADHYTYPAMLGPALALASIVASTRRAAVPAVILLPIFAILGFLSFQQSLTWLNDQTIFTHLYKVNPHNSLAINHLWLNAMNRQDYAAAERDARALVRENPNNALSYFDLAEALLNQNRRAEAMEADQAGIQADPTDPLCYSDLAALYAEDRRFDLAIPLFEHALKLNPNDTDAQTGLARARQEAATQTNATPNPEPQLPNK